MSDEKSVRWIEDMSDEEFLSGVRAYCISVPPDVMERLEALARIGARVQPRPIEEAPKDGTYILGRLKSNLLLMLQFCQDGHWRTRVNDRQKWEPICFYDLLALPT